MKRTRLMLVASLTLMATMLTTSGCDEDERVTKLATEAAERQAEQNREMARVTGQVAEGAKQLVDADAEARKELVAAHRELQAERSEIGRQRDQLEGERRQIAQQRRTESMLVPLVKACGVLVVCGLALAFSVCLLIGLRRHDDSEEVLSDLLVEELVSERPTILPVHRNQLSLEDEQSQSEPDTPSLPSLKP